MAASVDPAQIESFCYEALPHVSRTFALTIPVLDEPLRFQVALSYLICRVADTVEDHPDLSTDQRNRLLEMVHELFNGGFSTSSWKTFRARWRPHPNLAYDDLVNGVPTLVDAQHRLSEYSGRALRDCLEEMALGMTGFPGREGNSPVVVCRDLEELERYCHVVAGTVGQLLSRLFNPWTPPGWLDLECVERGRRFGLGLQLTNILKDHEADHDRGMCFIPPAWLEDGRPGSRLTPLGLKTVVERTLGHLAAGHEYILSLPAQRSDMRLFCLWSHHLAYGTLREVADPGRSGPAKVTRDEVTLIVTRSRDAVADDSRLNAIQAELESAIHRHLAS